MWDYITYKSWLDVLKFWWQVSKFCYNCFAGKHSLLQETVNCQKHTCQIKTSVTVNCYQHNCDSLCSVNTTLHLLEYIVSKPKLKYIQQLNSIDKFTYNNFYNTIWQYICNATEKWFIHFTLKKISFRKITNANKWIYINFHYTKLQSQKLQEFNALQYKQFTWHDITFSKNKKFNWH